MQWKILETTNKEKFYDELNKYKINGWYIHLETFGMDGNRCYIILSKGLIYNVISIEHINKSEKKIVGKYG